VLYTKAAETALEDLAKAINNAPARIPCMETDPDAFFNPGLYGLAKRLCNRCPVKTECLTVALVNDEPYGIWGALSPKERKTLKRKK